MPMLGFVNPSHIQAHGCSTSGSTTLIGSTVSAGIWTHIAVTYGAFNGLRLWINGGQFATSSAVYNYSVVDLPVTMTISSYFASSDSCSLSNIMTGQYFGLVDEFQLFSRELSSTDALSFANPLT
ncbi:unnamed protein product [Rotaria magnacalcarata]|nr:unnamed protein product [Rotaria magnacalcarata]CAF2143726.1 unnamed protein product [Rotaria magnacalcarata]